MSTPMIDRAVAQLYNQMHGSPLEFMHRHPADGVIVDISGEAREKFAAMAESGGKEIVIPISREQANEWSRSMLLRSIITGLENLMEDATDPAIVQAAIDAVRRIK